MKTQTTTQTNPIDHSAKKARKNGVLYVLIGGVIISFSPILSKLSTVSPTAEGIYRTAFGGLSLLLFSIVQRKPLNLKANAIATPLLCGIFFALELYLWQRSIEYVGPGIATMLGNLQVFLLSLAGMLYYKEKATPRALVAFPAALVGLFLLVGHKWSLLANDYKLGIYYGLLTAVFYGLYTLTLRISQQKKTSLKPLPNLIISCFTTAILLLICSLIQHQSLAIGSARNWICMLSYGVICQGVGWLIISKGLPKIPISLAGFLLLSQPVLAFVWDILIFNRPTPPIEVIGAITVLVSIYLSTSARKHAQ